VALTSRGKALVAGGAVVAVLGGGAALALTGNAPEPIQEALGGIGPVPDPVEPCPLTGETLPGDKQPPPRPALAVKVENTPDAQPLAGLNEADIVYEEVVEGGITRFVAVYHCGGSTRVGPVRSARTTDPKILQQLNEHPLLAFSGGAPKVVNIVKQAGVVGMTEGDPAAAFTRDDGRVMPHNLFTNTSKLWVTGKKRAKGEPGPQPVFAYDDEVQKPNKKAASVTIVFSNTASTSTAEWRWQQGRWVRFLEEAPMALETGEPIVTDNVVIQQVKTTESDIIDVAGYPSPEVEVTGGGKAWVLRDGRLIVGTWQRDSENDVTVLRTKKGDEIELRPGTAFVELAPTGMFDATITFGK
jgi:Protein of unknown function (DUF3048) N-terminal domain/Protein of unknown function (DUF3048) C-terminal domain